MTAALTDIEDRGPSTRLQPSPDAQEFGLPLLAIRYGVKRAAGKDTIAGMSALLMRRGRILSLRRGSSREGAGGAMFTWNDRSLRQRGPEFEFMLNLADQPQKARRKLICNLLRPARLWTG